MSNNHAYWFFHEYVDEARRFRVNMVGSDSEQDARRMHRQACEFRWVTVHVEPSVSSLFTRGEYGPRTLAPSHRPGQKYHTEVVPVEMPGWFKQRMADVIAGVNAA
jgi:hypothetical protein